MLSKDGIERNQVIIVIVQVGHPLICKADGTALSVVNLRQVHEICITKRGGRQQIIILIDFLHADQGGGFAAFGPDETRVDLVIAGCGVGKIVLADGVPGAAGRVVFHQYLIQTFFLEEVFGGTVFPGGLVILAGFGDEFDFIGVFCPRRVFHIQDA